MMTGVTVSGVLDFWASARISSADDKSPSALSFGNDATPLTRSCDGVVAGDEPAERGRAAVPRPRWPAAMVRSFIVPMGQSAAPTSGIPGEPFAHWSVHAFHPDYGFAWYCTRQRALITQTTVAHGHVAGGRVLCDWIDCALREDAAGIDAAGGIFLFHDFRSLARYDPDTRSLINDRIKLRKPGYARRTIIVVRPTPIWRMAMHVTDVTFALLRLPPMNVMVDMSRAAEELKSFAVERAAPKWLVGQRSS